MLQLAPVFVDDFAGQLVFICFFRLESTVGAAGIGGTLLKRFLHLSAEGHDYEKLCMRPILRLNLIN
jgi:hypothetical protein